MIERLTQNEVKDLDRLICELSLDRDKAAGVYRARLENALSWLKRYEKAYKEDDNDE